MSERVCFGPRPAVWFILLVLLLSLAGPAWAALQKKDAAIEPETAYNPKPDQHDLTLPMPCGGQMVFRAVGVPAQGFLWDLELSLGSDKSGRTNNDYYERRYSTAVSGPFGAADLPAAWRAKLPKAGQDAYYFYLIGKYEVTDYQWRAVMEGWCPSEDEPLTLEQARPRTNLTWFEAVDFSRRYTEWLLANHPGSLPGFAGDDKNTGYLRLPLETEWEYAARGGHMVSRDDIRHLEFFPLPEGGKIDDYAAYRPEGASHIEEQPRPIGSLQPNPLGLYDMQGNAAEMVLDTFHFSVGGRLHGAAGGFVRKGGSFLSSYQEILPGRREEVAFFQKDRATARTDMGFRLVLSGINTPAGQRPDILAKEWQKAGEGQVLLLDQGKNPLEEIDRLIAGTNNENEKENLTRLRAVLKDNNIALERQNNKAAEGLIRSSMYMVDTLKSYALRRNIVVSAIADRELELSILDEKIKQKEELEKHIKPEQKKELAQLKDLLKQDRQNRDKIAKGMDELRENERELGRSLMAATAFYRDKLDESLNYPPDMLSGHIKRMAEELGRDDVYARNLRAALDVYEKHLAMLRQGRQAELTRLKILRDILPEHFLVGLPEDE